MTIATEARSLTGLRPCPFCGSTTLSHLSQVPPSGTVETTEQFICIQCDTCGATGPGTGSKEQHRQLWQVRHGETGGDS